MGLSAQFGWGFDDKFNEFLKFYYCSGKSREIPEKKYFPGISVREFPGNNPSLTQMNSFINTLRILHETLVPIQLSICRPRFRLAVNMTVLKHFQDILRWVNSMGTNNLGHGEGVRKKILRLHAVKS